MSGIDRKQILRIDCTVCHGNGYVSKAGAEEACGNCEGRGVLEKEVDYKFDTQGRWSAEEKADAFGVPVSAIKDSGHSAGDE